MKKTILISFIFLLFNSSLLYANECRWEIIDIQKNDLIGNTKIIVQSYIDNVKNIEFDVNVMSIATVENLVKEVNARSNERCEEILKNLNGNKIILEDQKVKINQFQSNHNIEELKKTLIGNTNSVSNFVEYYKNNKIEYNESNGWKVNNKTLDVKSLDVE